MNIAFFGSSLVSAYWNGAATYYRGMIRALHERGHQITFYESDAFDRQAHRDIPDPPWARVVVYSHQGEDGVRRCLDRAASADLVIKASGNGVFDELLEAEVLGLKTARNQICFWDVDAPATLDRLHSNVTDPFRPLIPQYDMILTYGGGDRVVNAYESYGAKRCVPIYNGLDPSTHYPVPGAERFNADLAFLGNRLPDREARVESFFLKPAEALPDLRFLIGGSGWSERPLPPNLVNAGHVFTADHNAFNCTPTAVLNIHRESMARYGFSPATRVFEAAGAGACVITDAFFGVEHFFEPETEILVAHDGDDVVEHMRRLNRDRAQQIGARAQARALAEHTYATRAITLEQALGVTSKRSKAGSEIAPRKMALTAAVQEGAAN